MSKQTMMSKRDQADRQTYRPVYMQQQDGKPMKTFCTKNQGYIIILFFVVLMLVLCVGSYYILMANFR